MGGGRRPPRTARAGPRLGARTVRAGSGREGGTVLAPQDPFSSVSSTHTDDEPAASPSAFLPPSLPHAHAQAHYHPHTQPRPRCAARPTCRRESESETREECSPVAGYVMSCTTVARNDCCSAVRPKTRGMDQNNVVSVCSSPDLWYFTRLRVPSPTILPCSVEAIGRHNNRL